MPVVIRSSFVASSQTTRGCGLLAVLASAIAVPAKAQTSVLTFVEMTTNRGSFELLLNPSNVPELESLTAEFLRNVNEGLYDDTVINRLIEGETMHLGEVQADFMEAPLMTTDGLTPIPQLDTPGFRDDFRGVLDIQSLGLSNTRGTVAMSVSSNGAPSTALVVNLGDNPDLDQQGFIPFAQIVDMAPVDSFEDLINYDMSFRAGPRGNPTYSNMPFARAKQFLVVEQAAVTVVPEPASVVLLSLAAVAVSTRRRRVAVA